MSSIYIVDQDANGLATDLNAYASTGGHRFRFEPFTSVEKMFDRIRGQKPDLILLHHHWDGLTIGQVLQRVGDSCPDTRVIVFTGQDLNIRELIESVRFGVADYWPERGELEPHWMFAKIAHYCASPAWTVRVLRMPSGSLERLLQESLAKVEQSSTLETALRTSKARITDLESQEHRAWVRAGTNVATLAGTAIVLAALFVFVDRTTELSSQASFAFVVMVGLLLVIREGRLAKAIFKWGKNLVSVEGK